MRNIYSAKFSKKAQFFILSAVIIASIIVSLASVKNYVATGDAPKKFYYYSQQLEEETGAVVDFALYNDPTGTSTNDKLTNFLQQGIIKTKDAYPSIEIYSCYSGSTAGQVYCQNNGTKNITVTSSCDLPGIKSLYPTGTKTCITTTKAGCVAWGDATSADYLVVSCPNAQLIFNISNKIYPVSLTNSSISSKQFYFMFRLNTTGGVMASASDSPMQNGATFSS